MEYSGSFTIGRKENILFNIFVIRKRFIQTAALVFVVAAVVCLVNRINANAPVPRSILDACLWGLLGAILMALVNVAVVAFKVGQLCRKQKIGTLPFDVKMDKNGVHGTLGERSSDVAWKQYGEVREAPWAYYLFVTGAFANVLPKYQISSKAEEEKLRAVLRKYVDEKKLKLK